MPTFLCSTKTNGLFRTSRNPVYVLSVPRLNRVVTPLLCGDIDLTLVTEYYQNPLSLPAMKRLDGTLKEISTIWEYIRTLRIHLGPDNDDVLVTLPMPAEMGDVIDERVPNAGSCAQRCA